MSLLRTEKLHKSFGDTHAVDHVDFLVEPGEVLSLIGSNGAGKTTLVNLISGLLPPDSGKILLQERDITFLSVYDRIKAGMTEQEGIALLSKNGKLIKRPFLLTAKGGATGEQGSEQQE